MKLRPALRPPLRAPRRGPNAPREGVGVSVEAAALFARMDVQPSAARKTAINNTIVALKNAGVWSQLDALYVLAAADRQAAKLNWVGPVYDLTEVDGGNLTFTADVGFQGNGTSSCLDTGFNPTTAPSPKFVQDSGALGFWSTTPGQANTVEIGNDFALIQIRTATDAANHRVNAATSGSAASVADGNGLFVTSRVGPLGSDNRLYRDGVVFAVNTGVGASVIPANRSIRILGRNNAAPTFSARGCQMAFISAGLTAGQVLAMRNAF